MAPVVISRVFLTFLYISLFFVSCLSVSTNITIDDAVGDAITGLKPAYNPSIAWRESIVSTPCTESLSPCKAFGASWHEGTASQTLGQPLSYTVQFNGALFCICVVDVLLFCTFYFDVADRLLRRSVGTAIWLFHIIPLPSSTVVSFTLDGQDVGTSFDLDLPILSDDPWIYNETVLSITDLEFGPHTVVATLDDILGSELLLFDYAVYTCVQLFL